MDSASARCTERLDLVLFIPPRAPKTLVLVLDVIPVCALEPAGFERLASENAGIRLSKQIKSCSFYVTLSLREEKRGAKRVWPEPGRRGDHPPFLPGWAAVHRGRGRGLKGSG